MRSSISFALSLFRRRHNKQHGQHQQQQQMMSKMSRMIKNMATTHHQQGQSKGVPEQLGGGVLGLPSVGGVGGVGTTAPVLLVSFLLPPLPSPSPSTIVSWPRAAHTRSSVTVQSTAVPWTHSLGFLQSPHGAVPDPEYVDPFTQGAGEPLHTRSFARSQREATP